MPEPSSEPQVGAGSLDGWPTYLLWVIGSVTILDGVGMYVVPQDWFKAVPGVPETGPFNGHFVRDVGAAYVASGTAVILAVQIRAAMRSATWSSGAPLKAPATTGLRTQPLWFCRR